MAQGQWLLACVNGAALMLALWMAIEGLVALPSSEPQPKAE